MGDKNKLDQFYTNPELAKELYKDIVKNVAPKKRLIVVEPSAGAGSFSSLIKGCYAFDLEPKAPGITKKDFFKVTKADLPTASASSICFIGNPPFGKISNLAIRFFNHAATIGDTIAFVVPRTFIKKSVHRRLDPNFWIVFQKLLPKNSFIFEDKPYDVPCVFQIWVRRNEKRNVAIPNTNNAWFEFVDKAKAQAAVRRVGGRTGTASLEFKSTSEESNYYLRGKDALINDVVEIINDIDFSHIINNTAGQRSLSKEELLDEFLTYLNSNPYSFFTKGMK